MVLVDTVYFLIYKDAGSIMSYLIDTCVFVSFIQLTVGRRYLMTVAPDETGDGNLITT